jgi:D-tagatose-1,6-bisphosphate aldolase subunit GatZ/KbaZ
MSIEVLDELVRVQKQGGILGIPSICSAHPTALQTAMRRVVKTGSPILIESTCNQVNQFGGYTGMTPTDFMSFVRQLANEIGLPVDRLILGGDHLGPSVWQDEPEVSAMNKSDQLVRAYVHAGFRKIHLDASMKLKDDNSARPLELEISTRRTAQLAKACEEAYTDLTGTPAPRYIIGSEVPVPGGAQEHEETVSVTDVDAVQQTIEITHEAFIRERLESAWERVIGLVVQPGVEFGDDFILDYRPEKAVALSHLIERESQFVYEAHSTDYQTRDRLRDLVRDHFAILKVGPGLTFAFRQAVFALEMMEKEIIPKEECSNLVAVMEEVMLNDPRYWQKYYPGNPEVQAFKRKYSLSDRIRYYWATSEAKGALEKLMTNLGNTTLPLSLVSQWLPVQYKKIRSGELENSPQAIIQNQIEEVLDDYNYACGQS